MITIKAGTEEYHFGPINGNMTEPIPFNINIQDLDSLEIIIDCQVDGVGFIFGLLNE